MQVDFDISDARRLAAVRARGRGSFDEFIESMNRLTEQPSFSPEFDVLADFREVEYLPSLTELKAFAEVWGKVRASFRGRLGMVVRNRRQLKLGRFAAFFASLLHFELAVFTSEHEAFAWLHRRRDDDMDELKAKIAEVLRPAQLTALATLTSENTPHVRYVMTRGDDNLNVRFATFKGSRKVAQIAQNPKVYLVVGVNSLETTKHWVQVEGRAEISEDGDERKRYWHDGLKAYFKGPEDPNYVVGIIRPTKIEYMDMGSMTPEVWKP